MTPSSWWPVIPSAGKLLAGAGRGLTSHSEEAEGARGVGDARGPVLAWWGTTPKAWLEGSPDPPKPPKPLHQRQPNHGDWAPALHRAAVPLSWVPGGSCKGSLPWSEALQTPKPEWRVTPHGWRQQGPGDTTLCCPLLSSPLLWKSRRSLAPPAGSQPGATLSPGTC